MQMTFVEKLLRQAELRPNESAVVDCNSCLTFSELDNQSAKISQYLLDQGVTSGDLVGICLPQRKEFVVAILGIMRIGAGYVPIDAAYPKLRQEFIINDARIKIVITEEVFNKLGDAKDRFNLCNLDSPCYLIYTSGTTGAPKGVLTKQKSLSAFLDWYERENSPKDRYLSSSSFSFVASIFDLLGPLSIGAKVFIVEESIKSDLEKLRNYIEDNDINIVFVSTPLGSLLINTYPDLNIDRIYMGGAKMGKLPKTKIQIYNCYGCTESTSLIVGHLVNQELDEEEIPIGKPIQGVEFKICDTSGKESEEGELYIRSEQICEGYLHQDNLTKQKFATDGYYKTGDKVRLNHNGELEYLGRFDNLLKLRGYRIDPSEIETCAESYTGISIAVAEVSGSNLCLYYSADTQIDKPSLRHYLMERLADYMLPALYIQLDRIPLTINGKKNREALPKVAAFDDFVSPEGQLEQDVFKLVSQALGSTEFGVTTNLVSMGLNSLSAMSLALDISKELNKEISSSLILFAPTVREIVQNLKDIELKSVQQSDVYSISDNQAALFYDWTKDNSSTKYNIPSVFHFSGETVSSLQVALRKIVEAHPSIKRVFDYKEGRIVQKIQEESSVVFELIELNEKPENAYFKQYIKPFNLLEGPLYRFIIFTYDQGSYLFFDIHHTIFDGISLSIFDRELKKALSGEVLEKETEFIYEEKYDDKQKEYFDLLLDGTHSFAYPRSVNTDNQISDSISFDISGDEIKTYCSNNGYTLNSFFLTILSELLQRFSRDENFVISTINNGRNLLQNNSFGMFVRTLPLVCKSSDNETLLEAIASIQNQFRKSALNESYPYSKAIRSLDSAPSLSFVYQGDVVSDNYFSFALSSAVEPITIMVYPKAENFTLNIAYDTSLYSKTDISIFGSAYKSLAINSVKRPYASVKDFPILNPSQIKEMLNLSKGEVFEYNKNETIVNIVSRFEKSCPNAVAIVDGSGELTYSELINKSNNLAQYLLDKGVQVNDFVCIKLDRSRELIICVLAIMRVGAAYVPIEIAYPEDRKQYIIEDAEAKIVIDEEFLEEYRRSGVVAKEAINKSTPETPAYMIYTSGSTGKPKGVIIQQKALRAYIAWKIVKHNITPNSRHLLHSNVSFDASIDDISCPLAAGARVYVMEEKDRKDLKSIYNYIVDNKITTATLSTQLGTLLVDTYPDVPLQNLFIGGEKMLPIKKTKAQITNIYGPTEFTVCSSTFDLNQDKEYSNIPIGRPVPNSYTFICDAKGYLLPQGVVGEILLCGDQISAGYWRLNELTKEMFVPCPFVKGKLMYHTGDLGRYNEDGQIEYMGRIDHQVKLRGFRVELGEIETRACSFPGIGMTIVIVVDSKLVLYYTANTEIDKSALKTFLEETLAEFMMPNVYIQVPSMPLTPNGKIDRKKLPKPEYKEEIVEPKSEEEKIVYDIVAELLDTKEFGVTTNLVSMGLDSISAMSLSAKLFDLKGIELPTNVILKYHTIRAWLEHIKKNEIESSTREQYPLCENQERLFVEWELHRDSIQYNMPSVRYYEGIVIDTLKSAIIEFVSSHSYIKTHFAHSEGGIVQLRLDNEELTISTGDFPSGDINAFFQTRILPFNLLNGPLYRFEIYQSGSGLYLFSDFHHSIFDGISYSIFYRDIDKLLKGESIHKEKFTAFDQALVENDWIHSQDYTKAKKYFEDYTYGAEIATIKHSSKPDTEVKGKLSIVSQSIASSEIDTFCHQNGLTANSFFITALAKLLHIISREDNLLFTYISSGRNNVRMYDTAGMFVKTLPIVSKDSKESFKSFATKIQDSIANTAFYSKYPYSQIVLGLQRYPEISFAFEGGIDFVGQSFSLDLAKMPLCVIVTPSNEGTYDINFEYDASLYNRQDIESICTCYLNFIKNSLTGNYSLISAHETHKLLALSKGETLNYNKNETLVDMVLRNSKLRPEALALVDCESSMTYRELDTKSNQLAYHLIENGVGTDDFVCISLKRRKEFFVSAIAVMRAGAAYVPVDSELPEQRKQTIIEDSRTKLVINEDFLKTAFAEDIPSLESFNYSTPGSNAYMIYTSGSSGKPKGVIISHNSFRALIAWSIDLFEITPDSHRMSHTNFSFDASLVDTLCTLAIGACVYILKEEFRTDLAKIVEYITDNQIEGTLMSAQIGSLLINNYPDVPLKNIMLGGEKLMPLKKTKVKLINGYGPTEFTICSSYHIVNQERDLVDIPIGRAVPNTYSFICDKNGQLLPQGFEGELCLCGDQLGVGYWQLPFKTEEQFVDCPFLMDEKMYRTGDLCRYNKDGNLEYLGRLDNQVKHNGYRIELSEIETIAALFYGVECVVAVLKESFGICLYFVAVTTIETTKFIEYLSQKLPDYMIPDHFVQLAKMPLTPNGKVNLKALPNPLNESNRKGRVAVSEMEKFFVGVFKEILGLENIYVDDNFFEIGGSSLAAIRIVIAAEKANLKLSYSDVFESKTAEKLAARFETTIKETEDYEDISKYDYRAIDKLLKANNLEAFTKGDVLEFRNVLLLGSTGFLGVHLLHRLVMYYPSTHIYCLVRKSDSQTVLERLKSVYRYYYGSLPSYRNRYTVIEGDISNSLDFEMLSQLPIDLVINSAANVKHFSQGNDIAQANYQGTLNVIDFCKKKSARLLQMSTVSVSGVYFDSTTRDWSFRESELYKGQSQVSKYTLSKFLAERAILQAVADGELEAKIMRLGNLSSRVSDGKFQMNASSNSFMARVKAAFIIGKHCIEEEYMDLEYSPIDLVAEAVLLLAHTPKENVVFHPFNNYLELMGDLYDSMNEMGLETEAVSFEEYNKAISMSKNNPEIASMLTGLLAYDLKSDKQPIPLRQTANFTQRVLNCLGFRWTALGQKYIMQFLEMLKSIGFFDV